MSHIRLSCKPISDATSNLASQTRQINFRKVVDVTASMPWWTRVCSLSQCVHPWQCMSISRNLLAAMDWLRAGLSRRCTNTVSWLTGSWPAVPRNICPNVSSHQALPKNTLIRSSWQAQSRNSLHCSWMWQKVDSSGVAICAAQYEVEGKNRK